MLWQLKALLALLLVAPARIAMAETENGATLEVRSAPPESEVARSEQECTGRLVELHRASDPIQTPDIRKAG